MRKVGVIRERMAKILSEKGIILDASDLWIQEGGYRRHTWDLARWGGWGKRSNGDRVTVYSWDRMTDCVRNGIELSDGSQPGVYGMLPWEIEIHRLPKKRKPSLFD